MNSHVETLQQIINQLNEVQQFIDFDANEIENISELAAILNEAVAKADVLMTASSNVVTRVRIVEEHVYYVNVRHSRGAAAHDIEYAAEEYVECYGPPPYDVAHDVEVVETGKESDFFSVDVEL